MYPNLNYQLRNVFFEEFCFEFKNSLTICVKHFWSFRKQIWECIIWNCSIIDNFRLSEKSQCEKYLLKILKKNQIHTHNAEKISFPILDFFHLKLFRRREELSKVPNFFIISKLSLFEKQFQNVFSAFQVIHLNDMAYGEWFCYKSLNIRFQVPFLVTSWKMRT